MLAKTVIAVALSASFAATAASDTEYVEYECTVRADGTLWIQLRSLSGANRSLGVGAGASSSISFKGTTLSDGKWISPYGNFKEFIYRSPRESSPVGMLELVSAKGNTKALGWVSPSCWKRIGEITNGAVPTRSQGGT